MKLKRLLAAVTAAALAVSTMAVTNFTASAAEKPLQTGSYISGTLEDNPYATGNILNPQIMLQDKWGTPVSVSNYEAVEIEYTCVHPENIENVYVVAQGGSMPDGWFETYAPAAVSGTVRLDFTSVKTKTYEALLVMIEPKETYSIGDTFEAGLTVTSAKIIAEDVTLPANLSIAFDTDEIELVVDDNSEYGGPGAKVAKKQYTSFPTGVTTNTTFGELKNSKVTLTGIQIDNVDLEGVDASDVEVIMYAMFGTRWTWAQSAPASGNSIEWDLSTITDILDSDELMSFGYNVSIIGDKINALTIGDTVKVNSAEEPVPATAEIAFDTTTEFELEVVDASDWGDIGVTKAAAINVEKYPTSITKGTTYGKLKNTAVSVTGIDIRDTSIDGLSLSDVEVSVYAVWGAASSTEWDSTYVWTGSDRSTTFDMSTIDNVADDLVLKEMGYQITILGDKGGINDMEIGDIVTVNSTGSVSEPVPAEAEIPFNSTDELSLVVRDATEWGDPNVTNAAQLKVEVYPEGITKGLTYKKLKGTTLSLTGLDIRNTSIEGYPVEDVAVEIFAEWNNTPYWTSSGSPVTTWDLATLAATANLSDTAKLTGLGYIITITGPEVDAMSEGDVVKVNSPDSSVPTEAELKFDDTTELELVVQTVNWGDGFSKAAQVVVEKYPTGIRKGLTYGELKGTTLSVTGVNIKNISIKDLTADDVNVDIYAFWGAADSDDWGSYVWTGSEGTTWDLSSIDNVADDLVLKKLGYNLTITGNKGRIDLMDDGVIIKINSPGDEDDNNTTESTVLWEGTQDLGNWGAAVEIEAEKFSNVNAGDTIKFTYTFKAVPDEPWNQIKIIDSNDTVLASPTGKNDWGCVALSNATTYSFVISAADLELVKASGMKVVGHGVVLSKVECISKTTPTPPADHTHTPATVWTSDATGHWHTCSGCTDKVDFAAHTSDGGRDTTPATETTAGTKTYKCTVCEYVIKTETIPATGSESEPVYPSYIVGAPVIPITGVKDSNAPTINGQNGWEAVIAEITAASNGDKLVVDMNSTTKVPSTIFKAIKGKDVDLVLNMSNGIKWTINGLSVTSTKAIDFDVTKNTKHIPNEVVDKAEGSHKRQISLDHNGSFGCNAVMTYDVGTQYNGLYANLFYYNRKAKELELIDCSPISGGKANFLFTHASDYLITISDEPLGEFEDVSSAAGITSDNSGVNSIAFCSVLAVITLAFGFVVYKKRRHN